MFEFDVVDQWDRVVRTFKDREDAEQFCERWNSTIRAAVRIVER